MKLMQKPKFSEIAQTSLFYGSTVQNFFYNQGPWRTNNIPKDLENKQWTPEPRQLYLVVWHSTDPADPCASSENILEYIEPYTDEQVKTLINNIIKKIKTTNNMNLLVGLANKLFIPLWKS